MNFTKGGAKMILNGADIEKAIVTKEISILRYTWGIDKPVPQRLEVSDLNNSHKLTLHVGYLLRTLSDYKWLDKDWLFNKKDGIVDFQKLEKHQYELLPRESVLVFTNEYMEFEENYFGLVLPKVSGEENGVTVSTTYVDPQWKGVLQLVVTNLSEKTYLLQENSEIANLVICKMSGPATEANVERNAHYGIPWEKIYSNPDLRFWDPRTVSQFRKLIHIFHTKMKIAKGAGIIVVVGLVYYVVSMLCQIFSMWGK